MRTFLATVLLLLVSTGIAHAQMPVNHLDADHPLALHAQSIIDALFDDNVDEAIRYVTDHAAPSLDDEAVKTQMARLHEAVKDRSFEIGGFLSMSDTNVIVTLQPEDGDTPVGLMIGTEDAESYRITSIRQAQIQFQMR